MTTRQDFFIQYLGLGPIWKLNIEKTEPFSSQFQFNSDNHTQVSQLSVVDLLVLRDVQEVDQVDQPVELLFERLLSAFQINSPMSVRVRNVIPSQTREDIESVIQTSPAIVIAIFGERIAKILLHLEMIAVDEYQLARTLTLNQHPVFLFHRPDEIVKKPLLKRLTWGKMCALKSSLN